MTCRALGPHGAECVQELNHDGDVHIDAAGYRWARGIGATLLPRVTPTKPMAVHVDTSRRARKFVIENTGCLRDCGMEGSLCVACWTKTEALERMLNEAEDLGGERGAVLGEPDALTVDALRDTVREGMRPLVGALVGEDEARTERMVEALEHRTNNLVQMLVGLYLVRQREEDADRTDPVNAARLQ